MNGLLNKHYFGFWFSAKWINFTFSFSFFCVDDEIGLGQEFVISVISLTHKDENPISVKQYIKYLYIYI